MITTTYSNELARYLGHEPDTIFLFWKGRVALYALLKAMAVGEGDEIILPAYTCVVVPNAIIYQGAKPVYVDIRESTYNIDIDKVESAITEKTKVIICQNTYGLSSDLERLNEIAQRHELFTIEDCTHGFGGAYNGTPNGQLCDAAFFSTQWNKPFSSGVGGFAITKSEQIAVKLSQAEADLQEPTFKDEMNLKVLYFVRRYLINDMTYWPLVKFYRILSKHNLVLGSSSGKEITSIEKPDGFFKGFSSAQAREGLRNLCVLPEVMELRRRNARLYTEILKKNRKCYVHEDLHDNHGFLKYPILIKDREMFLELAEKVRVELGDWFLSPLHPVTRNLSPWQFDADAYPVAGFVAKHMVNLPTTPGSVEKVLGFVEKNLGLLLDEEEMNTEMEKSGQK